MSEKIPAPESRSIRSRFNRASTRRVVGAVAILCFGVAAGVSGSQWHNRGEELKASKQNEINTLDPNNKGTKYTNAKFIFYAGTILRNTPKKINSSHKPFHFKQGNEVSKVSEGEVLLVDGAIEETTDDGVYLGFRPGNGTKENSDPQSVAEVAEDLVWVSLSDSRGTELRTGKKLFEEVSGSYLDVTSISLDPQGNFERDGELVAWYYKTTQDTLTAFRNFS